MMLKSVYFVLVLWLYVNCDQLPDFYTFSVKDSEGDDVKLEKYRGKVTLVVNTASYCGFTDAQMKGLTKIHNILSFGDYFSVLAFPCNQFGEQEPGTQEQIEEFYKSTYKAEYPIFEKIDVLGENADPAFRNLISQSLVHPEWNFYKYLVDDKGRVVKTWGPRAAIDDIFDTVQKAVQHAKTSDKEL